MTLPDSTTTFLTVKELEAASSQEAAQAVASLQVSTDMDQFSDLFNVTTGGSTASASNSETNFTTLIDHSVTSLKDLNMLQSTSTNPTLGTAVLTNTSSEVMVTSTTLGKNHFWIFSNLGKIIPWEFFSQIINLQC